MAIQLREGPIQWVRHLNSVSTDVGFPLDSNSGVAPSGTRVSDRIHVMALMDGGTQPTATFYVYGYANNLPGSTSAWVRIGTLNSGYPISGDANQFASSTQVRVAEQFAAAPENFSRFATRAAAISGSTVTITTYVGFPSE